MLVVVVTAASLVFVFVNFYVDDFQKKGGAALKERLVIEDVWFRTGGEETEVSLYNYGKTDVKIISVFLNNVRLSLNSSVDIETGKHETITLSFSWDTGEQYDIKFLTQRGNSIETRSLAP
jgi:hypothetical protein